MLPEALPETVPREVLRALDADARARLEQVLAYEPDTAGGLMNTDTVTVRPDVSLDVVQRYLRLRGEVPAHTDALYVVDRYGAYLGALPLDKILTRAADDLVANVMERETPAIPAGEKEHDVARRFESADLVSAPVVDGKGILVGRITVDDVVDVIRAEGEHNMMSMAGLAEDGARSSASRALRTSRVTVSGRPSSRSARSSISSSSAALISSAVSICRIRPVRIDSGRCSSTSPSSSGLTISQTRLRSVGGSEASRLAISAGLSACSARRTGSMLPLPSRSRSRRTAVSLLSRSLILLRPRVRGRA